MSVQPARIDAALRALLAARPVQHSVCPSEVARALASDDAVWRALMPSVRAVAAELAQAGVVSATQRGKPVRIDAARGPIRLVRGPRFSAGA